MGKATGLAALLSAFREGERVFMGGSGGEVVPLTEGLGSGQVPALDLTTSFVPGINAIPAHLPEGMRLTNPFPLRSNAQTAHLALPYSGYAAWVAQQQFDTVVVQVCPPRAGRRASLGVLGEFTPLAMTRARRIIAVINPAMPDLPDAVHLDLDEAALVVEVPHPLAQYDIGDQNQVSLAIAAHVAGFIGDGAAVQVGLGKVPDAVLRCLADRRGLRMQSGMISDSIRPLWEAGALDPDWLHMSCAQVGTAAHYEWLRGRRGFVVLGCEATHAPEVLARAAGLVAVNSALEVDLSGRANLEFAGTRRISSVGGAPDFACAARLDPQGVSIVGLPSTAQSGTVSRIVPALSTPPSLAAQDVEVVVTENGFADLRGLTAEERAERLIGISHRDHKIALSQAWEQMARRP